MKESDDAVHGVVAGRNWGVDDFEDVLWVDLAQILVGAVGLSTHQLWVELCGVVCGGLSVKGWAMKLWRRGILMMLWRSSLVVPVGSVMVVVLLRQRLGLMLVVRLVVRLVIMLDVSWRVMEEESEKCNM